MGPGHIIIFIILVISMISEAWVHLSGPVSSEALQLLSGYVARSNILCSTLS